MRKLIEQKLAGYRVAMNGERREPFAGMRPAAVLIPLVERDEMTVMLTRRTEHLNVHAGQISFPGGRVDPGDESRVHTALRETEEEVGVAPEQIDVYACLDEYKTGTGFSVTPVLGFVDPAYHPKLDPFEVAEVFEVPFDFVMDPAHHTTAQRDFNGVLRTFRVIEYEDRYIWGATAGMLIDLSKKLIE